MQRRSLLRGAGTGLLLGIAQQDEESTTEGDGTDDDGPFDAFVGRLRTALAEVDVEVVAAARCVGYVPLQVTTQAELTTDEAFHRELRIVAEEFRAYVEAAADPPGRGLLVDVYESPSAADAFENMFASYGIPTSWAQEALETGETERYVSSVVGTVDPPAWAAENGGEPAVELVADELVTVDADPSDEVGVEARIENTGNGRSGDVELAVDWYDEDGAYLETDNRSVRTLKPGETWVARVYGLLVEPDEVAAYETVLTYDHPERGTPAGLTIDESELHVNGEARIHGALGNQTGEELGYVEAIGRVLDADGRVLGDAWSNEVHLAPGRTWRFDLRYSDPDRARLEAIEGYEVIPLGR